MMEVLYWAEEIAAGWPWGNCVLHCNMNQFYWSIGEFQGIFVALQQIVAHPGSAP
jgi:hypothetical protein